MPIYEYWCPECRQSFEKLRPMNSKDSEVSCPQCGSGVKKMLSVVALAGRRGEDMSYPASGGGCACGGACGCGGHSHN
jgi:putative FmdB family regulatory protein